MGRPVVETLIHLPALGAVHVVEEAKAR